MGVFPQYFCDSATEFAGRGIDHQAQPDLGQMKRMFPLAIGGYSWSKLVAEQSVLFAHQPGRSQRHIPSGYATDLRVWCRLCRRRRRAC